MSVPNSFQDSGSSADLADRPDAAERRELDAGLAALTVTKRGLVGAPADELCGLIDEVTRRIVRRAEDWTHEVVTFKGAGHDPYTWGQEMFIGPYLTLRHLGLLRRTLLDVARLGRPRLSGAPRLRPGGGLSVPVVPATLLDRVVFGGARAEVWLGPDVSFENFETRHREACAPTDPAGHLKLVLGAGNLAYIAVADALEALFVRREVAFVKLSPVGTHLLDVLRDVLAPLTSAGLLRLSGGGAAVGAYLCRHPDVQSVHLTGSDRTFDAVVFGTGEEGAARKARGEALLRKPVTAELGGVSPTIVTPGPWGARDVAFAAHSLALGLTHNAGFNCTSTRLLVQHEGWPQRLRMRAELQRILERVPTRAAYYPGAWERWEALTGAHPDAWRGGAPRDGHLPWTLAWDVPSDRPDPSFSSEAFCSFAAETALSAADAAAFLDRATEFVNDRVQGSLSCSVLIHPASLRDARVRSALSRCLNGLRYGTVGVNVWAGVGFAMTLTPWGAFPGGDHRNVGSGIGMVHNPLRLPDPHKSVLHAPFRTVPPPASLPLFGRPVEINRALLEVTRAPSPRSVTALGSAAVRGWLPDGRSADRG